MLSVGASLISMLGKHWPRLRILCDYNQKAKICNLCQYYFGEDDKKQRNLLSLPEIYCLYRKMIELNLLKTQTQTESVYLLQLLKVGEKKYALCL